MIAVGTKPLAAGSLVLGASVGFVVGDVEQVIAVEGQEARRAPHQASAATGPALQLEVDRTERPDRCGDLVSPPETDRRANELAFGVQFVDSLRSDSEHSRPGEARVFQKSVVVMGDRLPIAQNPLGIGRLIVF